MAFRPAWGDTVAHGCARELFERRIELRVLTQLDGLCGAASARMGYDWYAAPYFGNGNLGDPFSFIETEGRELTSPGTRNDPTDATSDLKLNELT